MSGLVDSALAAMRTSSQRVDIAALNIANVSTPGFKRQLRAADRSGPSFDAVVAPVRVDLAAGKVMRTGRPLDLAINGDGFFQLRAGDRLLYSRQGAFALDAEGRVVTPQGYVLQQADGGDLTLETGDVTIAGDGAVTGGDRPLGRVGLFKPRDAGDLTPIDGGSFAIAEGAAEPAGAPSLRQGALESSNFSLGDEMVGLMGATRGAETGARLVQVYDDLLGKAVSTFGQAAR